MRPGVVDLADIVAEKNAWDLLLYFTSLLTLAGALNEIRFINWVAESFARTLGPMSPTLAAILLVTLFFRIHYIFSGASPRIPPRCCRRNSELVTAVVANANPENLGAYRPA